MVTSTPPSGNPNTDIGLQNSSNRYSLSTTVTSKSWLIGAFLTLVAISQITIQTRGVEQIVQAIILVCVLVVLVCIKPNSWSASLGLHGRILILFCISFLSIGSVVLYLDNPSMDYYLIFRQIFYFLILLAAMLSGRYALQKMGIDLLLKRILYVLSASCIIILSTPLLRQLGLLPEFRISSRLTGVFSDPNDAGLVACMTVVISACLIYNGRYRRITYPSLLIGIAAALATFSMSFALVLGMVMILGFVTTITRWGQQNYRQNLILSSATFSILILYLLWSLSLLPSITISSNPVYRDFLSPTPDPVMQTAPPSVPTTLRQLTNPSFDTSDPGPYYGHTFDELTANTNYDMQIRPVHDSWTGADSQVSGRTDSDGNLQIYWQDFNNYFIRASEEESWTELSNTSVQDDGGIAGYMPNISYDIQILPQTELADIKPITLRTISDNNGTIYLMWPTWQFRERQSDNSGWAEWEKWKNLRIAQNNLTVGDINLIRDEDPELQLIDQYTPEDQVYSLDIQGLTKGYRYDIQIRPTQGYWLGDILQVSSVADDKGLLKAIWQDPNQYMVRFDGTDSWSELAGLASKGSHGIGELEPEQEYLMQILPRNAPADTPPSNLQSAATVDGIVYLYWPNWQYRLRSANAETWRQWHNAKLTEDNVSLFARPDTVLSAATFRNEASDTAVVVKRRWRSYEIGMEGIMEKPLVGHGLRQFSSLEGAFIGARRIPYGVHNIYMTIVGEAGIIPLLLYIAFLFCVVLYCFKAPLTLERDALALLSIVVIFYGFLYHHLFISGIFNVLLGLTSAIAAQLAYQHKYPDFSHDLPLVNDS